PIITISCTHPKEEILLAPVLHNQGPWQIFLAPRHPERFAEVASWLKKQNLPFSYIQDPKPNTLVLIDKMGQLASCYAQSDLVILGGSFVPDIGGHNPIEPCLYQAPVFFGPY